MKKILGIFIFLLIFACIGLVNAEDISLENINSTDFNNSLEDNISTSLIENTSHSHTQISSLLDSPVKKSINAPGGTFTQLQTIINSASSGDTIEITGDYVYDSSFTSTGISITKNLKFDGNGYTLNGNHLARIFNINNVSVVINDLNFINGYYKSSADYGGGGAISATGFNGSLIIENCNFSDNHINASLGGAIVAYLFGDLNITNSNFYNNSLIYSYEWGYGNALAYLGSLYNDAFSSGLTIFNSSFVMNGNSTVSSGGSIWTYTSRKVNITYSIFDSNTCLWEGAGLRIGYMSYNVTVTNNIFGNNTSINGANDLWNNPDTGNGAVFNYNWWGSNTPNWSKLVTGITPENWVIMNFTSNGTVNPFSSGSIPLKVKWENVYNSTSETFDNLIGGLPEWTIKFSSNVGTLDFTTNTIKNEINNTLYYPVGTNDLTINATIDNQTLSINLVNITGNITTSNFEPQIGGKFNIILSVTNKGPKNITFYPGYEALVLKFNLPYPLVYNNSSGSGIYDNNTGQWFVGNLTVGQTKKMNITVSIPFNPIYVGMNVTGILSKDYGQLVTLTYSNVDLGNITLNIQNKTIGSYTELQSLIDATPVGGVLNVPFNIVYDPINDVSLKTGMIINKTITLEGNNFNISGDGKARVFRIINGTVLLNNISIINGYSPSGTSGGSGIQVLGQNTNLIVNYSYFFNNSAREGDGFGGGIWANAPNSLIVNNSIFINNYAKYGGGAVSSYNIYGDGYVTNKLIVNNSYFYNNSAGYYAGAVYVHYVNDSTVMQSIFINNTLVYPDDEGGYAIRIGLYGTNSKINYNVFIGKTLNTNDFWCNPSVSSYNLNDNWWGTNTPNFSNRISGTTPQTYVVMNFTTDDFIDSINGGSLILKTTLNTTYNSTSGNYSTLTGGIIPTRNLTYSWNTGSITPTSSNISEVANAYYYYSPSTSNVELNATIDNQKLTLYLINLTSEIKVNNLTPAIGDYLVFTINVTNNGPKDITYSPGLDALVINFTLPYPLQYSNSVGSGYYDNNSGLWFVGNLSSGQTKKINITVLIPFNDTFVDNNITINESYAWGHLLLSEPGFCNNLTLNIQNKTTGSYTNLQTFIDATPIGGVLNVPFNVIYDPIGDAWLKTGMRLNKTITINGNNHNISGENQARIFRCTESTIVLNDLNMFNGFYSVDENMGGGAIFFRGDNLTLNNCNFYNNSVNGYGGVLYSPSSNVINVINSNFYDNKATSGSYSEGSGAALCIYYSDDYAPGCNKFIVYNSTFYNNTAVYGGAIFTANVLNINISYSTFINNTATMSSESARGGVMRLGASGVPTTSLNVTNNVFYDNKAGYGPSAIWVNPSNYGNFNNNWWGTNNPNFTKIFSGNSPPTSYFIMNFTNLNPILYTGGSTTLEVNLTNVYNSTSNNYTTITEGLPTRTVYFEWILGNVIPNNTNITNTVTTVFNYLANMNYWTVNATIDNQTLWIGSSDIGIKIIPSNNTINDGENITYIVIVTNMGPMNATNISALINLPILGLNNINITCNNGSYNNMTSIWKIGNLNVGENVTLIINATLADPGPYLVWNTSIINVTDYYDHNFTNNTFISNVTVNQIADLEIHKNLTQNIMPQTKDNITYMITVFNNGPSTAVNVTVFDNLSSNLVYLNSSATVGYYNETTGIWFIDNITPFSNETLNITVHLNKSGRTDNWANVTSNITDNNLTNNFDNYSFETPPLSDLWVTIDMDPQASNFITFHIQAGNNGIEAANGTVVVFNLSNLYIYFNHTTDKESIII